jgi:hypothetical protein
MSLERGGSTLRGSDALMASWGLGRGRNCHPRCLSCPRPLRKDRARWILAFVPRATDMLSTSLAGRFYWVPYDGALANAQGVVFCHLLSSLVF